MTEQLLVRVNYDYYTNKAKFLRPIPITVEGNKYYCREIGESFNMRDNEVVKESVNSCYRIKVFKAITILEGQEKYRDNIVNSTRWELVEVIKEYLKEKAESIDVDLE